MTPRGVAVRGGSGGYFGTSYLHYWLVEICSEVKRGVKSAEGKGLLAARAGDAVYGGAGPGRPDSVTVAEDRIDGDPEMSFTGNWGQREGKSAAPWLPSEKVISCIGIDSFLLTRRSLRVPWLSGIDVKIRVLGAIGPRPPVSLPEKMNDRGKRGRSPQFRGR